MYGSIPQGMTTAMPANAVNVGALSYGSLSFARYR